MKQILHYCAKHILEILFALVCVLTLALATYGALKFNGAFAVGIIVLAVALQAILGGFIQNRASWRSVLQMRLTLWLCYMLMLALLMVGCFFSAFWTGVAKFEALWGLGIVLAIGMLVLKYRPKILKAVDEIAQIAPCHKTDDDPKPEPAEKLPYVYYDHPVMQKAHTICYHSPYLGKDCQVPFKPRKRRGALFDNVRGIQVAENLVLLRYILFTRHFPDDIRAMAKQYKGRFPTEAELLQIYAKFKEINQNLYECGEPLLLHDKYLCTCGNADEDVRMNWCIHLGTGQKTYADCDSFICAVLVE